MNSTPEVKKRAEVVPGIPVIDEIHKAPERQPVLRGRSVPDVKPKDPDLSKSRFGRDESH